MRDRDEDDFATFVSARWSTLYRLAYLLTGSNCAAEDLLQSALEKAYVSWPRFRRLESPEAYLRKILVNTVLTRRRQLARSREVLREHPPEVAVEAADDAVVNRGLLWPLVCTLPTKQRAVIVLRYYEDLSEAEAAEVLGCSVGTVKSQTHDAVRALRRGVGANGDEKAVSRS